MLLEIKKITVPPGQKILLHDISWSDFEAILEDLGEHRASRIAYDNGILEIMTPLPEHEVSKVLIGDLIKALLEELEINFWSLGSQGKSISITLDKKNVEQSSYIHYS